MKNIKRLLQAAIGTSALLWTSALPALETEAFLQVTPNSASMDGVELLEYSQQYSELSCTPAIKNKNLKTWKRICISQNKNSLQIETTKTDQIVSVTLMDIDNEGIEQIENSLAELSCHKQSRTKFTAFKCQQFNIVLEAYSYNEKLFKLALCAPGYCTDKLN